MFRARSSSAAIRRPWLLAMATAAVAAGAVMAGGAVASPAAPEPAAACMADCQTAPLPIAAVGPAERRPGSPLRGLSAVDDADPTEGEVVERLDAGPYTYLRVVTPGGAEAWLATLGRGAGVGARVAIRSFGSRARFASRRLDRTFERLHFAMITTTDTKKEDR